MKYADRLDRVKQPYGDPRNPKGIRVPAFPKLKVGPTLTEARRYDIGQKFKRVFFDPR